MTLHLTCAFQVIKLPNESVIALLFLTISTYRWIDQTPQLQNPCPVHFTNIDNFLICILIDLGWVYKLTISKSPPPPPLPGQICQPDRLTIRRLKEYLKNVTKWVLEANILTTFNLYSERPRMGL